MTGMQTVNKEKLSWITFAGTSRDRMYIKFTTAGTHLASVLHKEVVPRLSVRPVLYVSTEPR
jgi:hypothetical protein